MNVSRRIRGFVIAPAIAAALIFSGCTPEATPAPDATSIDESDASGQAQDTDLVIAEAQIDLAENGTVVAVLRSLTADDEVMHLRYALVHEGGDAAASTFPDLGIGNAPTVADLADLADLRAYRPFCSQGSWTGDSIARQTCSYSVLGTVPNAQLGVLPPDTTLEIGVLLPAPQGQPDVVEVLLGDGLPSFSQVPVSYVADAR